MCESFFCQFLSFNRMGGECQLLPSYSFILNDTNTKIIKQKEQKTST